MALPTNAELHAIGLSTEKLVKELLEKQQQSKSFLSRLGRLGTTVGLGVGLSAGGVGAAKGIDALEDAISERKNYQAFLEKNPDLAKREAEVKPLYETVQRFSPTVASDPLAAGAAVRRFDEFKQVGLPLTDLGTLARIEKDRSGKGRPGFRDMLSGLDRYAGGIGA